jgi:predicted ATP-grasp superfamily ATP-dependent carboligase
MVFQERTLVVAFEGWNDAGDAASVAGRFLSEQVDAEVLATVDPEEYYDFQYSRPQVQLDATGSREIVWPGTDFYRSNRLGTENLYFLIGVEPSRRWRTFVEEILELIEEQEIKTVIFLGALYTEVPHTRPIHLVSTSQSIQLRERYGLEKSDYSGPVGILTVLGTAIDELNIPTLALWAEVPHYTHGQPCPKAALALIASVEGYIGREFNHKELAEEAFAWERKVDEMVEGDDELSGYIAQLETSRDAVEVAEASSDAMVEEVERFLRNKVEPEKDEDAS